MNHEKVVESKKPEDYFFRASASDFKKIPGSPIAYWVAPKILNVLDSSRSLGEIAEARMGLATGNNEKYVRLWFETSHKGIGLLVPNRETAKKSNLRWFPYCKGGQFRKWFGNNEHIVDWFNDGNELQTTLHPSGSRIWAHNFNLDHIFEDSLTWSDITSGRLSVRYNSKGFLFDGSGTCAFFRDENEKLAVLGLLNTQFSNELSKVLNPTLHFQTGDFRNMPYKESLLIDDFIGGVKQLIAITKKDWDSYETSWDFTCLPLLQSDFRQATLKETYQNLRLHWFKMTMKMQQLEEENNRIFIEAYGLQDELTPDVPLKEITLTCNPFYRYGKTAVRSDEQVGSDEWEVGSKNSPLSTSHFPLNRELEERLLADTMKEFISYAVGCMFGRYSLDKEGLILANQGETLTDYYKTVGSDECEVGSNNSTLSTSHFPLGEALPLSTSHSPLPTLHFPLSTGRSPLSTGRSPPPTVLYSR